MFPDGDITMCLQKKNASHQTFTTLFWGGQKKVIQLHCELIMDNSKETGFFFFLLHWLPPTDAALSDGLIILIVVVLTLSLTSAL